MVHPFALFTGEAIRPRIGERMPPGPRSGDMRPLVALMGEKVMAVELGGEETTPRTELPAASVPAEKS